MTQAPRAVTIVGASLAGLNAAEALRREGFDGPVTLIGAETHLPYDRPPLSKQVLAGDWEPERAALTDPEEIEEDGIEARLGVRATALDLDARELTLHTGETVEFDGLVIATGARCRTMPGTEGIGGVHVLRSLDDCLALRADFEAMPQRVVVVGAGFIGAEVAATARGRGLDVTMVEALPTPLSRVLGDEMGEVCAEVHRDHGVDLRTAVGVERISGDGRVERVTLSDGSTIDADVVVVGIGVIPNTEWLDGSGLEVDDGVVCDASCLAADRVTAAGDVARWPNELFGETMRVEHWDNAAQQGAHAARRLLDAAVGPFTPVPWFWSDQYDRKIQLAGRVRGDDEVRVVTGSVDERRFAAIYGRAGRIVGVLGFNRPRHVMRYRALIEQGASFDEALAAEF
ncbi:MAG: NAD(P)/FAD-dependent oxidoreductase [Acidimicrobiaceae bacterium]|nr:NAD(P)/FAD-dependent oxidoreductase [Acidimicrobiaceae bacterium]MYF44352.1 NAD(P)/FAD-dependent oxidoreductase [Acidimicrobiaceae bacterium]MYJ35932.1 NAD(P)/FAD-dependent oxidoreductase [Acidimicrobiaceae bacterium]